MLYGVNDQTLAAKMEVIFVFITIQLPNSNSKSLSFTVMESHALKPVG